MLVHLVGWAFLIAAWTLPVNKFKTEEKGIEWSKRLAAIALGIFIGGLIMSLTKIFS